VAVPQTVETVYLTVSRPAATPVITPVTDIEALPVVVLQVPPPTVDESGVVADTQTAVKPEIVPADGSGLTVTRRVTKQPVGSV